MLAKKIFHPRHQKDCRHWESHPGYRRHKPRYCCYTIAVGRSFGADTYFSGDLGGFGGKFRSLQIDTELRVAPGRRLPYFPFAILHFVLCKFGETYIFGYVNNFRNMCQIVDFHNFSQNVEMGGILRKFAHVRGSRGKSRDLTHFQAPDPKHPQ